MTRPTFFERNAIVGTDWRLKLLAVTYGTQAPLDVVAIQYGGRDEWEILVNGAQRQKLTAPPDLSLMTLVNRLHDEGFLEDGLFAHRQEKP